MAFTRNPFHYLLLAAAFLLGGLAALYFPKGYLVWEMSYFHTPFLDYFFKYGTYLGDGVTYGAFCLLALFVKRRFFFVALVGIALSTMAVQGFKHLVFPDDAPRPLRFVAESPKYGERAAERVAERVAIDGVTIRYNDSFPSGHTATAFLMATLLALFAGTRPVAAYALALAVMVGASRMYLFQHFYVDAYFGALFGAVCGTLAYSFFQPGRSEWMERGVLSRKKAGENARTTEA